MSEIEYTLNQDQKNSISWKIGWIIACTMFSTSVSPLLFSKRPVCCDSDSRTREFFRICICQLGLKTRYCVRLSERNMPHYWLRDYPFKESKLFLLTKIIFTRCYYCSTVENCNCVQCEKNPAIYQVNGHTSNRIVIADSFARSSPSYRRIHRDYKLKILTL